jgi:hypothetical protein
MKREAVGHTKMKKLCRVLDIPIYQGVGILESIWHLTARQAQRGDIGKLSNEDIAFGIDYRCEPEDLISALVRCGWLDRDRRYRLIVHDWHEHADDAVKRRVMRSGLGFSLPTNEHGGQQPPLTDDGGYRRAAADDGRLPEPVPVPDPLPDPEPVPSPDAASPPFQDWKGPMGSSQVKPRPDELSPKSPPATKEKIRPRNTKQVHIEKRIREASSRHHKHRGTETTTYVLKKLTASNLDWDEFERRHTPYCRYWDRKGWNFCPLTVVEWFQNGMPPPPPEVSIEAASSPRSSKLGALNEWARE